ncbi:MAG: WD40 repeat domain-containing protein [Candidatus Babeliales bacterium]|nr:WD40 repeat domain-containing protein [Candidatus Babeliales bacterium]
MKKLMIIAICAFFYCIKASEQRVVVPNDIKMVMEKSEQKTALECLERAKLEFEFNAELDSLCIAMQYIRQNTCKSLKTAMRCLGDLATCDKLKTDIQKAKELIQLSLDRLEKNKQNKLNFELLCEFMVEDDYFPTMSWSKDGSRLAYISYSKKIVVVWDVITGKEVSRLCYKDLISTSSSSNNALIEESKSISQIQQSWVSYKALSALQRYRFGSLLSWGDDSRSIVFNDLNYLIRWDIDTNKNQIKAFVESKLISMSPDCSRYATVSGKDILIWDAKTFKQLGTLSLHECEVYALAWSSSSKHLASGSVDSKIIIWNVEKSEPKITLSEHCGTVTSLDWSKDLQKIVSCGTDELIFVWAWDKASKSFKKLTELEEVHCDEITSVSWAPDNLTFASCSNDETVRIWHANGEQLQKLNHSGKVTLVKWSPDGSKLASISRGKTIKIWSKE